MESIMTIAHFAIKVASACTAVLAFATVLSAPVQANQPRLVSRHGSTEVWAVRVSYKDLNLSSAAGREAFDKRVRSAAHSVCGHGLYDYGVSPKCARKAYADAQPRMIAAIDKAGGAQLASNEPG
jgi:UrcA family protein